MRRKVNDCTNKRKNVQNDKSRQRISSADEFKVDLEGDTMKLVFSSFYEAVSLFNEQVLLTPELARVRGFEAALFNAKIAERIQSNFPDNWRFGKYSRFFLAIQDYVFLFKKLSNSGKPMNVITNSVEAINSQQMGSLFGDSVFDLSPIVYFGYKKDKFGNIVDPQFVYMDEGEVKWRLNEDDIADTVDYVKHDSAASVKPAVAKLREDLRKAK